MTRLILLFSLLFLIPTEETEAQRRRGKSTTAASSLKFSENIYDANDWRNIGPFRGGRSSAVTGVKGKPNLFYFGATGGGVWRTKDGGNTWENISDGYFGGSIGAVAVSEWDPNVIYVGGGEVTVRGNVSSGFGMFKSVDAGKTWSEIGLKNSRHIPRVVIDPKNPDIVFAAVLGDLYKSSNERGVYKSTDGGKTWKRTLFANPDAGAVELVMDPNNPRILFASTWRIRRTPYSLESGGEGSALWKSTDGGETWKNISDNDGLPKGMWGISGVSVSAANSQRVYAIIENDNGGVYVSNDGGETWRLRNSDRSLRQRAWYYSKIYADTQDEDKVYVLNVSYHVSTDGGRSFSRSNAPHGDHHDLWIAPEDPNRLIMADDGGAQISYDAGENWSTYMNQPTAQFYRVTTDNAFPYRIYGAQQDNSTVRIRHRSDGYAIGESDWESTAGGESAHIAVDPTDDDIVYGGSYGGFLTRVNHETNEVRAVNVWPDNPMGHGAEGFKYRFQWNFPIFISPHNPKKVYAASQHLHVTYNGGQTWEIISPDLTRNDPSKLGPSGGPITKDNTGVEYYCTIFAVTESPQKKGLIWTGSDDGKIHLTKDGGKTWSDVTPAGMPEWMMINSVEVDPFNEGGLYVAGTRYKLGDYTPYLYRTKDYGKTWEKITNGIPNEDFTRVVRADPERKGLLYAGTETQVYVSFDDGDSWNSLKMNMPTVPITDLAIKENNLIAATQGRSFWMIDDLTVFHQLESGLDSKEAKLFKPMDAYRMGGGSRGRVTRTEGENHPGGVMVHYFLKDTAKNDVVKLEFFEEDGTLIKTFSTKPDKEKKEEELSIKEGSNRFVWNMRYADAERFPGLIMWAASTRGPTAIPGNYTVKLTYNDTVEEQDFMIIQDPRSSSSLNDIEAQFDFMTEVLDKVTETHQAIVNIRKVKDQIKDYNSRLSTSDANEEIISLGKEIISEITEIEQTLYQTKNQSGQDPLNYPIRLNNKLAALSSLTSIGDFAPTDQAIAVKDELTAAIDIELKKLYEVFETKVPTYNQKVKSANIDAIQLKK